MSPFFREFQNNGRGNILGSRQHGSGHERIVQGINDEGGYLDVPQPRLATRLLPVVFGIAKAVQRSGYQIVELI
jgi:hypothetical protein